MYANDMVGTEFPLVAIMAYFLLLGITLLLGIGSYVLTSISLYTIAKRRQISKPWLAWLPIGNYWTMGSIVDDYDKRNGLKRNWRTVLLVLTIVFFVAFILLYIFMIVIIVITAVKSSNAEPNMSEMIGLFVALYVSVILIILPAIALEACGLICTYKIYESTVPEKSLKYFLLSLLVPFAGVICLFLCRNKGYSNPPANYNYTPQQAPVYYPPQNRQ